MQELVHRLTPCDDVRIIGEEFNGVDLQSSALLFRIVRTYIPVGHVVEICLVSDICFESLVATLIDVSGIKPKRIHSEKINSREDRSILALKLLFYFKK